MGPNETVTARFRENNPGRWLYHCQVFTHQTGMAGWYSYRRTFRKRGRYTIICSLHPDNMRQAIRVVR